MEATFHRRRTSEAQLTPSHRQLKQQQKGGARQFPDPPPPSLLHRNRSLKVFFGGDVQVEGLKELGRAVEQTSSPSNSVFSNHLGQDKEEGRDRNRLKRSAGDDYMIGKELGKLGRSRKGHCQFEKGKKKEYLKIGLRANHLEAQ